MLWASNRVGRRGRGREAAAAPCRALGQAGPQPCSRGFHRGQPGAAGAPTVTPAPVEALPGTGPQDPHLRNAGCCGPPSCRPTTRPRPCPLPELQVVMVRAPQPPPRTGTSQAQRRARLPLLPTCMGGTLPARQALHCCLSWILPDPPPAPLVPTPLSLQSLRLTVKWWPLHGMEGGQGTKWPEGGGRSSRVGCCGACAPWKALAFTLRELGSHCRVWSRGGARSTLRFKDFAYLFSGPRQRKWLHSLPMESPLLGPPGPVSELTSQCSLVPPESSRRAGRRIVRPAIALRPKTLPGFCCVILGKQITPR